MDTDKLVKLFKQRLPNAQLKINEPLAPYTTLKIGGPADLLFIASTEDELVQAIRFARENKINWVVLGWGSNILVSDAGFRGLVIRNQARDVRVIESQTDPILDPSPKRGRKNLSPVKSEEEVGSTDAEPDRHEHVDVHGKKYAIKFDDLNYDESELPVKYVQVSTGMPLGNLISWSLDQGLTGLQWFARIPGTVGGAIYNNIHGGSHYFEEVLEQVTVLDEQGELVTLKAEDLGTGYDKTRFHQTKEIIINALLKLRQGDVEMAKQVSLEWARRKAVQPANSAGCTFKNISQEEREKLQYPTTSVAYIIEWILKWSNKKVGGARISDRHHAFIVNDGQASAADMLSLIKQITSETLVKTGLKLYPEIFFIGFEDEELEGINLSN